MQGNTSRCALQGCGAEEAWLPMDWREGTDSWRTGRALASSGIGGWAGGKKLTVTHKDLLFECQ